MSVRRTAIAATLACVAGFAAAHAATDGFEAFTLESARRLQALFVRESQASMRAAVTAGARTETACAGQGAQA